MKWKPPPNKAIVEVLGTARRNPQQLFARSHGQPLFISKGNEDFGFFEFVKARATHLAYCRIASATDAWKPKEVDVETGERRNATLVVPDAYLRLHRDALVYVVDTDFPCEIMVKPILYRLGDNDSIRPKRLQESFGVMLTNINPFLEYPCAAIVDGGDWLVIRKVHSDFEAACGRTCREGTASVRLLESQGAGLLDELISGKSRLVALNDGTARYVRLIINFCNSGCAAADAIIQSLQTQYHRTIERHTISKPSDIPV